MASAARYTLKQSNVFIGTVYSAGQSSFLDPRGTWGRLDIAAGLLEVFR